MFHIAIANKIPERVSIPRCTGILYHSDKGSSGNVIWANTVFGWSFLSFRPHGFVLRLIFSIPAHPKIIHTDSYFRPRFFFSKIDLVTRALCKLKCIELILTLIEKLSDFRVARYCENCSVTLFCIRSVTPHLIPHWKIKLVRTAKEQSVLLVFSFAVSSNELGKFKMDGVQLLFKLSIRGFQLSGSWKTKTLVNSSCKTPIDRTAVVYRQLRNPIVREIMKAMEMLGARCHGNSCLELVKRMMNSTLIIVPNCCWVNLRLVPFRLQFGW